MWTTTPSLPFKSPQIFSPVSVFSRRERISLEVLNSVSLCVVYLKKKNSKQDGEDIIQRLPDPGGLKTLFTGLGSEFTTFSSCCFCGGTKGSSIRKLCCQVAVMVTVYTNRNSFGRVTERVVLPGLLLFHHTAQGRDTPVPGLLLERRTV